MKKLLLAALLLFPTLALADRNIYTGETTTAQRGIDVYLVDATDGVTEETGVAISGAECRICKNGAACANCAGTWVEAENGQYVYQTTTGEVDTLGGITIRIADAAARKFIGSANVVAYDPTSSEGFIPARGTAQSVTGTTIRLAAVEAFGDDELNGNTAVFIVSATLGAGQTRCIVDYVASTDTATVDTWTTTPTGTITYALIPSPNCSAYLLGGSVQSGTDLKDFADDGYDPATNKVQGVVLVDTTTTLTNGAASISRRW